MKVNSQNSAHLHNNAAKAKSGSKMSREEVQAKIKAKFGDDVLKSKKAKDNEQIKTKETKVTKEQAHVGIKSDIANNDPHSEVTQEKLRSILQTGSFQFNDRERKALGEILGS